MAVWIAGGCGTDEVRTTAAAPAAARAEQTRDASGVVVLDRSAQQEAGIEARKVEVRSLPEVIQATGRVTINENKTWRVGAVTEGRIVTVLVTEGDRVEEGQVLARMHSHDTHEARAEYRKAVAELDRLKAAVEYAKGIRDRTKRLLAQKAASVQQVEQSEAELRNAETALRNGEVELDRTRKHLEEFLRVPADVPADYVHTGATSDLYDLIPIPAPAAGTLLRRNVTAGTVVEPSNDLFVITDLSTLWTMAAVSEDYLPKLRIGMPVKIYVRAYPDRAFPGRLTKLDTELDPTTRTIMARVEAPNARGLLKPEMYATVELELNGRRAGLFVPEVAVQQVNGEDTIFVRTAPERFEPRAVTLGPGVGGSVEVLRGLQPGDEVVIEGSFLLKSQLLKASLAEE